MSLVDYAGRKKDILALRGQRAVGAAPLTQDVLAGGGQVCVGIVKLAQWFVTTLLTRVDSVRFRPGIGTSFYTKLMAGQLRTETDVFVAFGFAVGDLKAQARTIETTTTPRDEQFADAVLLSVAVLPGYAQLHVSLRSKAGDSRTMILPIPTS